MRQHGQPHHLRVPNRAVALAPGIAQGSVIRLGVKSSLARDQVKHRRDQAKEPGILPNPLRLPPLIRAGRHQRQRPAVHRGDRLDRLAKLDRRVEGHCEPGAAVEFFSALPARPFNFIAASARALTVGHPAS